MVHSAWRLRKSLDVALVEVYSGPSFIWAEAVSVMLSAQRIPFIFALHGGNLPTFAADRPYRVRRMLSRAAAVVAPSGYLRDSMCRYRSGIHLLPNAVDVDHYPYRLRREAQPKLVWLRSFHEIYRPEMAPRVLAAVAKTCPQATLRMVGPDKGDGSFEKTVEIARSLGVLSNLEFVGAVPKECVPRELAKADIFINTSAIDNTPVSIIEALSCGLCVVSTNVGGIGQLLSDGRDSLLTPTGDPERMADACLQIIGNQDLAVRLSRQARSTAEQFSWSHVLPQWEQLLTSTALN